MFLLTNDLITQTEGGHTWVPCSPVEILLQYLHIFKYSIVQHFRKLVKTKFI